jgi:hypothetical protein
MVVDVSQTPSMNQTTETKLARIQRTSVLLRAICTALLVPVGIAAIGAIVVVAAGRATHVTFFSTSLELADLGIPQRLLLIVGLLATFAVALKGLQHLRHLLGNYGRREIFTVDSAQQIRQFGITCILWGLIKAVWVVLPFFVAKHPPGLTTLSLDTVFIGAVIVGMSWFAEMAAALREENDLTI